jgi:hypothetical protein
MEQKADVAPDVEVRVDSKKATKKAKRSKGTKPKRSKNGSGGSAKFPRHSVEKALRIPRAIIDQNAGKPCSEKESAKFVGVGFNGPYRV